MLRHFIKSFYNFYNSPDGQKPTTIQKPSDMQDQAVVQKLEKDSIFGPEKTREQVMKFREAYREVFGFRYQRRALSSMYSEALSIVDANTVELTVEQKKQIMV